MEASSARVSQIVTHFDHNPTIQVTQLQIWTLLQYFPTLNSVENSGARFTLILAHFSLRPSATSDTISAP